MSPVTGPDFTDRVALVVGGSRGIGRRVALAFARAGADVVVASRKLDACREVCSEIESLGRRGLPVACHIGHWDELDGLVEAAYGAFGHVDVLVNNAGMSPLYDSLDTVTEELFDKVVAVNLKGPFRLTALVAPRMADGAGGSILNISSYGALNPQPDSLPYAAAKAGLNALTEGFARAYGPRVRVNAIIAGAFLTDISNSWDADRRARMLSTTALGRFGDPDEVLGAVLYLSSDAASFTTGALLKVDGGRW